MKRFLLSVCLLPGLALAQGVSDKTKKYQRFFKKAAPIEMRAAAPALLDSVYTYQTEQGILTDKVYYTYDEAGLMLTELRKSSYGQEGEFVVNYKGEYTYSTIAGGKSVEEINYALADGEWVPSFKRTTEYNQKQMTVAMYDYYYKDGKWMKDEFQVSAEFNADGYPTVLMDSTFVEDGTVEVMRMDATYDKKHNVEGLSIFAQVGNEWIPAQKAKLTYDEAGRQLSQYHEVMEDGEWTFSFFYTYEYDERGNMIRETDEMEGFDKPFVMRYQNFYSDNIVTKNEQVDARSSIRITLNNNDKTLSVDLGEEQRATLTIINAGGAIVRRVSVNQLDTLPLYDLSGYYIVHIQTAKGVKSQSVIIR